MWYMNLLYLMAMANSNVRIGKFQIEILGRIVDLKLKNLDLLHLIAHKILFNTKWLSKYF